MQLLPEATRPWTATHFLSTAQHKIQLLQHFIIDMAKENVAEEGIE